MNMNSNALITAVKSALPSLGNNITYNHLSFAALCTNKS